MNKLKVTTIGSSVGVVIPKDMLTRLNISKGDYLYVVEAADGGYHLTSFDPDFAQKMDRASDIMARYRNTLAALA